MTASLECPLPVSPRAYWGRGSSRWQHPQGVEDSVIRQVPSKRGPMLRPGARVPPLSRARTSKSAAWSSSCVCQLDPPWAAGHLLHSSSCLLICTLRVLPGPRLQLSSSGQRPLPAGGAAGGFRPRREEGWAGAGSAPALAFPLPPPLPLPAQPSLFAPACGLACGYI